MADNKINDLSLLDFFLQSVKECAKICRSYNLSVIALGLVLFVAKNSPGNIIEIPSIRVSISSDLFFIIGPLAITCLHVMAIFHIKRLDYLIEKSNSFIESSAFNDQHELALTDLLYPWHYVFSHDKSNQIHTIFSFSIVQIIPLVFIAGLPLTRELTLVSIVMTALCIMICIVANYAFKQKAN